MEKLKRPINRDLLFFKKTRKIRTLKLMKHHSYSYVEEYQFFPSSMPLSKNSRISLQKRSRQGLYSMPLLCHCSGNSSSEGGGGGEEEEERDRLDAPIDFDEMGSELKSLGLSEEEEEEETDSIDKRAEKFIERIYEEIRMQRQQSALEYTQMLDRSS